MNSEYIIGELDANKSLFFELFQNLDGEIIEWKRAKNNWNLLEILCHLCDEEIEDFRARLVSTLENPKKEFDPIDPVGWVTLRNYSEQDIKVKIKQFIDERNKSLDYLRQLDQPKWDNFYEHPKFGNMTAKMFFTNWLAHDYLHLRQIIKIKFDYLSEICDEKLNYAGEW